MIMVIAMFIMIIDVDRFLDKNHIKLQNFKNGRYPRPSGVRKFENIRIIINCFTCQSSHDSQYTVATVYAVYSRIGAGLDSLR